MLTSQSTRFFTFFVVTLCPIAVRGNHESNVLGSHATVDEGQGNTLSRLLKNSKTTKNTKKSGHEEEQRRNYRRYHRLDYCSL